MKCQHITFVLATVCTAVVVGPHVSAQSADWTDAIWREPQVRYLLADMTDSGKPDLYRKYATEERDPDSREAIRLWDAGVRVINIADFERKWVNNQFERKKVDDKILITRKGSNERISGMLVKLSTDRL